MVAALAGVIFDAAEHLAVKAVLEHQPVARLRLGDDHAYEHRVPAAQPAGREVGDVVELLYGLAHAALCVLGDGALAVEDIGNGGRGHARPARDVLERCSSHAAASLQSLTA